MPILLNDHPASGALGIEPRWTRSDKRGVGTAYAALSRVWFTISRGIVNEVYYPTIDRPQIRDLQYLVTDGAAYFRSERQMDSTHESLASGALGYRITNVDPQGGYRIVKEVIADPHQPCVLIHTRLEGAPEVLAKLRLFALLAPHLEVGGRDNNGNVVRTERGNVLTAHKGGTWLVLAASVPFLHCSCGYAGTTGGWQDLVHNFRMDRDFDCAPNGNIALTGELDIRHSQEFVLALAFGNTLHHALVTTAQTLSTPFADHRARFLKQWQNTCQHFLPGKEKAACDGGQLYHASHSIILAHEDKTYDGALIASLSIPWGEAAGDDDVGGYHLVWTRDMCNSATGLLAAGTTEVPLRALIYLACTQKEDGGFYQNFWIDGEPHWRGIPLDETAFPVILAWRLHRARALRNFDPYPMVLKAARYLIHHGPVTPEERWEEASGYSPSTLAAHIAALICAGAFARERGQHATAQYLEEYADFLESHLEEWTVTTEGILVPGIPRHFIRIHPAEANDPQPDEDANHGNLELRNQRPGERSAFPGKDIVDAGFLELVRYGIRKPGDQLIEDSLRVIDAVLKVDTPFGPSWRRYNHDGYGRQAIKKNLFVTLPSGEKLSGSEAEERLVQLTGATFRDFLTTVYQHQEAIRAVLTHEPRERNDAIDRLLGLSVYRNLMDAIAKAKASDRQKTLRREFEAFEGEVRAALSARENDLKDLREEVSRTGIPFPQQNEKTAFALTKLVMQSLADFARQAVLPAQTLSTPNSWTDLATFETAAKRAIQWFRAEMPDVKSQAELYRRHKVLLQLKTDLEHRQAEHEGWKLKLRVLDQDSGGLADLAARVARANVELIVTQGLLRKSNSRAALIREAIFYLEQADANVDLAEKCPICDHPVSNQLACLRNQWEEQLQSECVAIENELKEGQRRRDHLQSCMRQHGELEEEQRQICQQLGECRKQFEQQLGITLHADGDPTAILQRESQALEQRGRDLQESVDRKQEILAAAEKVLDKIRLIREILTREQKKAILEKVQESPAYKEAEELRDQLADLVSDLESIQTTVAAVAHEEAQGKLQKAEKAIDSYFHRLTRHPAIGRICLLVEERAGRNSYQITRQNGQDLVPILSHGDLNALALAIFLGLASAGSDGAFGFVMMDDPSQNLGSRQKKRLVEVLNEISHQKMLFMATMDSEFRNLFLDGVMMAKTEYVYESWTAEKGPAITLKGNKNEDNHLSLAAKAS